MKSLMLTAIRELEVQDVPDPRVVGSQDALVRIRASGICGSDVHGYSGQSGRRVPPLIMGHEASGEVVELGAEASGIRVGERVVIQPLRSCGTCVACRDGKPLWCSGRSLMGMNAPGAFAEYVVWPAAGLLPLPSSVSFEHAALTEPLAVALHAASQASFGLFDTALVVGAGTIGLLVLSMLRLMGPRRLVAVDISDERLAAARSVGADLVINPTAHDVVATVREALGDEGVDHVFEAVGVSRTFQMSVDLARRGGEVIWIGNNERHAEIDVQSVVTREIGIRPSYGFTRAEFGSALASLADNRVPLDSILTRKATLEEGPHLFEELLVRRDLIKCEFTMMDS